MFHQGIYNFLYFRQFHERAGIYNLTVLSENLVIFCNITAVPKFVVAICSGVASLHAFWSSYSQNGDRQDFRITPYINYAYIYCLNKTKDRTKLSLWDFSYYFQIFWFFSKGLFTWSGGPRSSGVGFFCFHALEDTKQKKPTPLDLGPPLHVNIVLMFLFLLPENCQYPFVPLFRLLNVFVGTYFLVYDLLTPFSYACLKLIYIAEKTDPQSGCLFILLRLSSQQILIFHILSNC